MCEILKCCFEMVNIERCLIKMNNNIIVPNIVSELKLPLKVIMVGEIENQPEVERKSGLPNYECMLCKSGNGHLIVEGRHYVIEPDSVFFLDANRSHRYYPETSGWHTCWVVFDGENVSQILKQLGFLHSQPRKISETSSAYMNFSLIYNDALSGGLSSIFKCSSQLYSLLIDLSCTTYNHLSNPNPLSTKRIGRVLKYIENNVQKNIGLNEMADLMDISPQYLCKLFKEDIGIAPYEYLTSLRIQKSKEFMFDKKLKISDISSLLGFNDTSYFCSVFKKHEGITPQQFRKLFY